MNYSKYIFEILFVAVLIILPKTAIAQDCAADGVSFRVQEGTSSCILVGQGNKVVHCVVSGLNQSAALLITSIGFNSNSNYFIPSHAVPITYNTQRLTFSGYGNRNAEINFQYYGPWDPSYSFELTCTW